jgi:hypothetical protein
MAEGDTVTQIQAQPPYIEKRAEQLLASVFGDPNAVRKKDADGKFTETEEEFNLRKFGRAGIAQQVPGFQFAGFTPAQQAAFGLAGQQVGAYKPALQQAIGSTGLAGGALTGGLAQALGATQAYDPSSAQAFMDPYQQQVTQQALAEFDKQNEIAKQGLAAQAQQVGAFGGSRMGVQEAELGKNLADIKSRRIFEDMSRNFQQAQQAAMGAQQAQQQRQLGAAQLFGQTGQGLASLGKTQAGLGALGQQLGQGDIQSLLGVGGMQQQLGQAQLEANRQQQIMAQQEPFRRLTFASDILRGVPSGQIAYTQQPGTSPFAQALGLGIAGLGAAGQFGQGFGGLSNLFGGE